MLQPAPCVCRARQRQPGLSAVHTPAGVCVAAARPAPARQVACHYYTQYDESSSTSTAPREVHHVHARLPLRCVALGDNYSHVISCENGGMGWCGVSGGLLKALETSKRRGKEIATVALGRNQGSNSYYSPADPQEVYFMMRDTGTTYMGSSCEQQLRDGWCNWKGDDRVEWVAFAPSDGWLAQTRGGATWRLGLPDSLEATLADRLRAEGGVEHLSVGHNGEWFLLFKSGVTWWQGVHPTLRQLLKSESSRTGNIEWVELGPDGTFVALFDNHTVWCGSQVLTDHLLACL